MKTLENKVVVITGAGSGIGRATAELFAQEGAAVVVADRDESAARQVAAGLPGHGHRAWVIDVTEEAGWAELAETLDSGRDALDLGRRTGSSLGDLGRLYGRIRDDGTALDAQLMLLLSERDPAVLRQSIPVAERRVDQVVGLIRRLRSAVAAGLGDRTDDNLAMLTGDLDREVTALDAGLNELHTLNRNDAPTILNPLTGRTDS